MAPLGTGQWLTEEQTKRLSALADETRKELIAALTERIRERKRDRSHGPSATPRDWYR
jgi:hypothetical protein